MKYLRRKLVPQDGEDLAVPASSSYWGSRKYRFYDVGEHSHGNTVRLYGDFVVTVAVISILILL